VSRPVYECSVCGTRQPVDGLIDDPENGEEGADDGEPAPGPPERVGNLPCRLKYGGCCRMAAMELVEEATWEPDRWELYCPTCDYGTVAWGEEGFGDSRTWTCPRCEHDMHVLSVSQVD